MSAAVAKNRKAVLAGSVAVVVVAGTAGALLLSTKVLHLGQSAAPAVSTAAETKPLETDAGKVGDLQVTQEAMELAEIQLGSSTQRSVAEKLPISGSVEAGGDRVAEVTPRVSGKILSVHAVVGDEVRAGQTLATLESTELAQAQAAWRQAGSRAALAQNNLERQRKLAGLGVFGKPRVEEARKEDVAARGEVDTTQDEIAAAKNQVNEARSEKGAADGEVAAAESAAASAESEAASGDSEIQEAESQVDVLQAAQIQARTRVQTAQSKFNRYDILLKEQLVSKQDWEQAQADLRQAEADVDAAKASIAQAKAKVATARAHQKAAQAQVKAAQAQVKAAQAKVRAEQGRAQQAAAKIETALARQAQLESRLAAARERREIARQALAREERVLKGGYGTSREIVEAEAAVRQARLEQQAAAQTVRLLGGSPGGASTVVLTAPIAGRIQERTASPGKTVDTEHALFKVINLDLVWAQLAVTPKDLPLVRTGQRVALTSETAPGRTFSGTVSAIGSTADEGTRAVRVRVALVNKDGALRPETFVRGNIITDVRQERVTVPTDALQEHNSKPTVYVALGTPGAFEVRHVKLGVSGEGWREISEGLEADEKIAATGTFYLKSEALKSALSDGCCAGK